MAAAGRGPVRRGASAARRLNAWGVYTIGELAAMNRDTAVRLFGTRGDTLWNYANGREADPLTKQRARDNSYGNSVTMPKDLEKPEQADATMLALCDSVGRRLRRDGKTARVVTVQLVDNAFRRTSHQTTLPNPTNSTDRLYHVAVELMRQMWPARPVRLVGVSAEKTSTDNFEQMDLFTDTARLDKQEKLDRTADALRKKIWRRRGDPGQAFDGRRREAESAWRGEKIKIDSLCLTGPAYLAAGPSLTASSL